MAEHGDFRDRLAALERAIREMQKTVGRLGAMANLGEVRTLAKGEVVGEDGLPATGSGQVLIKNLVSGEDSHTVEVWNPYPDNVAEESICIIGQINGIWCLIAASC